MGAGGWLIASQSRQATFSRTCWITFHDRGTTSSVSVTSSPSRDHHALPGQVLGERPTGRTPAVEGGDAGASRVRASATEEISRI